MNKSRRIFPFRRSTLVTAVAAGFAINLMVAWGCVISRSFKERKTGAYSEIWTARNEREVEQWEFDRWRRRLEMGTLLADGEITTTTTTGSAKSEVVVRSSAEGRREGSLWEHRCGWPMYSFHGLALWAGPTDSSFLIQYEIKGLGRLALPLEPMPHGCVINTALYATVLWVMAAAIPTVLVRGARRRRGRCPGCGYLAGDSSVCTECGESLRER